MSHWEPGILQSNHDFQKCDLILVLKKTPHNLACLFIIYWWYQTVDFCGGHSRELVWSSVNYSGDQIQFTWGDKKEILFFEESAEVSLPLQLEDPNNQVTRLEWFSTKWNWEFEGGSSSGEELLGAITEVWLKAGGAFFRLQIEVVQGIWGLHARLLAFQSFHKFWANPFVLKRAFTLSHTNTGPLEYRKKFPKYCEQQPVREDIIWKIYSCFHALRGRHFCTFAALGGKFGEVSRPSWWAVAVLALPWAQPPWPGLSSPLSLASALPFLGLVWAQPPWPELGSPPSLGWAPPFLGLSHGPTRDLTLNCFNLLSPQSKQKYQKLAKRQQTHSSAQLIAWSTLKAWFNKWNWKEVWNWIAHFALNSTQPAQLSQPVEIFGWFDPCHWFRTNLVPDLVRWYLTLSSSHPDISSCQSHFTCVLHVFAKTLEWRHCRGSKQWLVQSIEEMGIKTVLNPIKNVPRKYGVHKHRTCITIKDIGKSYKKHSYSL